MLGSTEVDADDTSGEVDISVIAACADRALPRSNPRPVFFSKLCMIHLDLGILNDHMATMVWTKLTVLRGPTILDVIL